LENFINQPFEQLGKKQPALKEFVGAVLGQFNRNGADALQDGGWQGGELNEQMEIINANGKQIVLVRGTRLPDGVDSGFVVVFDDVTTMVQAQRDAAWGEVARRLAHEIKNPLTPIQLSAERLEHKLASKLDQTDAEMLRRSTNTIISQVSAMKTMVNEFSEYARAPALNLAEVNLNKLIEDVLALYETMGVEVKMKLDSSLPIVLGDATMLRQVLHNLLQNAQDALEGQSKPTILVSSETQKDKVKLSVIDNGEGFPVEIMSRVFEPYMTTKRHGTGLGLSIVRKIIEEHKGSIKIENQKQGGACVIITLPIAVKKRGTGNDS
jgi:nitrogen fixation/metabolism regulation signal transduction histidine kinase